ncbi:hypothetical protein Pla52n_54300 [Stieleria varia]|uniref:Uncharacterized protein n=1 Tax=Stieleria varia TaxID=2528005 RepID=A0A5C6A560_9BACT|nr:hypothetical protein Pla52n_54300 [Stieleria varia]
MKDGTTMRTVFFCCSGQGNESLQPKSVSRIRDLVHYK